MQAIRLLLLKSWCPLWIIWITFSLTHSIISHMFILLYWQSDFHFYFINYLYILFIIHFLLIHLHIIMIIMIIVIYYFINFKFSKYCVIMVIEILWSEIYKNFPTISYFIVNIINFLSFNELDYFLFASNPINCWDINQFTLNLEKIMIVNYIVFNRCCLCYLLL